MDTDKDKPSDDDLMYARGSHPVAGGVGAAGGALAGGAMGAALGPLGAVTGAVLGGTFGAIAAKGIAEGIDPEAENSYWEKHHLNEPYYDSDYAFDDYGPAYRMGWQLYEPTVSFDTAEEAMSKEWTKSRGSSRLEWELAREAARAGWNRAGSAAPKD